MNERSISYPVKEIDLDYLRESFSNIPEDYIELLRISDGMILESAIHFLSLDIHSSAWCIDISESYPDFKEFLPGVLVFANDLGSQVLCWMAKDDIEGVYACGYASADPEEAYFVAPTIRDFLSHGTGWRRLMNGG